MKVFYVNVRRAGEAVRVEARIELSEELIAEFRDKNKGIAKEIASYAEGAALTLLEGE